MKQVQTPSLGALRLGRTPSPRKQVMRLGPSSPSLGQPKLNQNMGDA